jgi:poly-beta-1,6-N-acetyl-D-glucosamine synthase
MFYLLLLCAFIQWIYWVAVLATTAFAKWNEEPLPEDNQQPVSVIICAKNEAENLKQYLPTVLEQQYVQFEVIVVNDHSSDETLKILSDFKKKYVHLKIENLSGIQSARFEWIALTDADCRPASNLWLQYITKPLNCGKELSIGYSPHDVQSGLLNRIIRYETFFTAAQYFGFTLCGLPYMATGRNMAYTKAFFKKSKLFFQSKISVSGDDDLLVNELSDANKTQLVLHENSFMISKPLSTWRDWFRQKTRHYQAGFHYKFKHRITLGLFYFSWLMLYLISFILLTSKINLLFIAEVLFFMILTKWLISYLLMKRFKSLSLWIYMPLFDFLLPLFLFTLGTLSLFNKGKWKN